MRANIEHQPQFNVGIFTIKFLNIKLIFQLSNSFTASINHFQTKVAVVFLIEIILVHTRNNEVTVNYSTHFLLFLKHYLQKIIKQSINKNQNPKNHLHKS